MLNSWNQEFRSTGFRECSAWFWEKLEGRLTWPYYIFPVIRHPGFVIITPSFFLPFSVVFSNQRFSNCSSTMDVGYVKRSSDCFCGNKVRRWILSFAVTFAAAVLWSLDTILFSVGRFLSLSFGFQPLFLSADDVFKSMYVAITLGTAALVTPNEVDAVCTVHHPATCI